MKLPAGLCCPNCSSTLNDDHCAACGHDLFRLGDVICASKANANQVGVWRHQLHALEEASQKTLEYVAIKSACVDLLPLTRERYQSMAEGAALSTDFVTNLFADAGVMPEFSPDLAGMPPGFMAEYHTHILRDWARTEQVSGSIFEQAETLLDHWPSKSRGKTLVIGSGAGRVAWDVHCSLPGEQTVAFDLNPLLQLVAHRMIRGETSLAFPEVGSPHNSFPHLFKLWPLLPSNHKFDDHGDDFTQLVGDIWQLDFGENTYDFIVTSWFVDAHGRDNRDFLEKISRWLKPGGYWINTGPLLYPEPLPMEYRYYPDEIKGLMNLAGFEIIKESSVPAEHLPTPFREEVKQENIWTFIAQYQPEEKNSRQEGGLPDWLLLHHLPIQTFDYHQDPDDPVHPAIISLIDGTRSVNDLVAVMRPNLPPETDVKFALLFVLGELLGIDVN